MLFQINNNGAIDVSGVPNYETLVITDDIVPNKKYVDDAISSGGSATALGYLWTDAVTENPSGSGSKTLVIGQAAKGNDTDSTVVIGNGSIASTGAFKSVVIGNVALANTGANRAITIGDLAESSSTNATAIGRLSKADHLAVAIGNAAVALGDAGVAIAVESTASATNSTAIGRQSVADREGEINFSAASTITAFGDVRASRFILFNETTDATETELFVDTGASVRLTLADDSTMTFKGLVTARRTDLDNESAGFKIEGVIDNNAGTVALVGVPSVTGLGDDAGGWSVAITADDTGDALAVKVTGEAAKTIRWSCVLETCEARG